MKAFLSRTLRFLRSAAGAGVLAAAVGARAARAGLPTGTAEAEAAETAEAGQKLRGQTVGAFAQKVAEVDDANAAAQEVVVHRTVAAEQLAHIEAAGTAGTEQVAERTAGEDLTERAH